MSTARHHLPRLALPLAAALLTPVAALAPARAESPGSPCTRWPAVHPSNYTRLPRNAPALVFVPPQGWFVFDGSADDYILSLQTPDGNVVPTSLARDGERTLIRPKQPLTGMQVILRYRNVCTAYTSIGSSDARIELDAEAALPETIGSLVPATAARREREVPWDAACTPPASEVYIPLEIKMSPGLSAYRGVARWEVSYRGRTQSYDYGELVAGTSDGRSAFLSLKDDCTGVESVGGPLEVKVHVAGATVDPPALFTTVTASCPALPGPQDKGPPACSPFDAGPTAGDRDLGTPRDQDAGAPSGQDAGAPSAPPAPTRADAAPPPMPMAVDADPQDDGGCSVGRTPRSGAQSFLPLALLAALGRALRRCTSRTPRR
jgi:hypothetical protein